MAPRRKKAEVTTSCAQKSVFRAFDGEVINVPDKGSDSIVVGASKFLWGNRGRGGTANLMHRCPKKWESSNNKKVRKFTTNERRNFPRRMAKKSSFPCWTRQSTSPTSVRETKFCALLLSPESCLCFRISTLAEQTRMWLCRDSGNSGISHI